MRGFAWLLGLVAAAAVLAGELAVPPLTGRLVDHADLLDRGDVERVTGFIREFETQTNGQMAVLIVPSLEGQPIEEFSIRVADAWKLGDAQRDDGLLLVIAVNDRKTRLEVGQGFEGRITDGRAGDLLRAMTPYFREERYADGIVTVISGAAAFVTGEPLAGAAVAPPQPEYNNPLVGSLLMLLFIGIFVWWMYHAQRVRRGGGMIFIFGGGGFRGGGGGFGGGFSGGGGGFSGGGASGGW